jgi:hypothetical protein
MGTYSSGTSPATRKFIILWMVSGVGGGGSRQPPSRYATMISRARARTAARSSSVMKPWTSFRKMPMGRTGPSRMLASPVMWIIDIMSVGTLTSSSAAAMASSSSVIGLPAGWIRSVIRCFSYSRIGTLANGPDPSRSIGLRRRAV